MAHARGKPKHWCRPRESGDPYAAVHRQAAEYRSRVSFAEPVIGPRFARTRWLSRPGRQKPYPLSSPYNVCRVRTARSVCAALIRTENLISDVVMARILIFCSDKALNACAATPAWLRMP